MKISKRHLRRIVRECMGDMGGEVMVAPQRPCPIKTAEALIGSGAGSDEVMAWIADLMGAYVGVSEQSLGITVPVADGEAQVIEQEYPYEEFEELIEPPLGEA